MSSTIKDVILGLAPALFGLIGTVVGAGLTYQASGSQRRAKEDDEARNHLAKVSNAIHRLWWLIRVGASRPEDVSLGPEGIPADLQTSVIEARTSLLTAGIPYRIAAVALEPAERLAFRHGQRKVLTKDPDDAQALVVFLLGLLDHRRGYRRSSQVWTQLNAMEELARGRRPLEGVPEDRNTFGYLSPEQLNLAMGVAPKTAEKADEEARPDSGENSADGR
jgi:hypothetical protein